MPDDIQDTFKRAVGDRLKSHFFFGFVLAWLAFHARALYITLFLDRKDLPFIDESYDVKFVNKLAYIDSLGYTWMDHWIGPIVVALLASVSVHYIDELVIKPLKQKGTNWGVRFRGWFAEEDLYTQAQMDGAKRGRSEAVAKHLEEKKRRETAEEEADSLRERVKIINHNNNEDVARLEGEIRKLTEQLGASSTTAEHLRGELRSAKQQAEESAAQVAKAMTERDELARGVDGRRT